jgi:hypothetical protein
LTSSEHGPNRSPVHHATFVISATRFFAHAQMVGIQLDAGEKLTSAASGFTPDK